MTDVTYTARFTRNMGNYESLQIEVGVTDSPRGEEKVSETYNRVKDFVESRLLSEVDTLERELVATRAAVKGK